MKNWNLVEIQKMGRGSWDIANKTNNFSRNTGQCGWAENRDGNHCVCLGAYALYNAKKIKPDRNYLKCDAIPNTVFSKNYIKKFAREGNWEDWNGLEINGQIKDGLDNLMYQCYTSAGENRKRELSKNYCKMIKNLNIKDDRYC